MDWLDQRKKIIEALIGHWHSVDYPIEISLSFSEHISPTGDGFNLQCYKKDLNQQRNETFNLNFLWTNNVLRVYFNGKNCVVCFIENRLSIGFFCSTLSCNEITEKELIVIFLKS